MKKTAKIILLLFALVLFVGLFGFIVLFGGLGLVLFGFLILIAPIILEWSVFHKSERIHKVIGFIHPHARKYSLLIIVIGVLVTYIGFQVGDAMYGKSQPNTQPVPAQKKEKPKPQHKPQPKKEVLYKVTKVVDGDTFEAEVNGKTESIRMILVDTPETVHPSKPAQPFGQQASEFTKQLLTGKSVKLEKDAQERDKYGRLLMYVYLDGKSVQELLLEKGLARVSIYPPNTKYVDKYRAIETQAKSKKIAIWSIENYVQDNGFVVPKPKPKPVPKPKPRPQPEPQPQPEPESAYYANCSAAKRAGAAPLYKGDPGYRSALDRDKDGVACES